MKYLFLITVFFTAAARADSSAPCAVYIQPEVSKYISEPADQSAVKDLLAQHGYVVWTSYQDMTQTSVNKESTLVLGLSDMSTKIDPGYSVFNVVAPTMDVRLSFNVVIKDLVDGVNEIFFMVYPPPERPRGADASNADYFPMYSYKAGEVIAQKSFSEKRNYWLTTLAAPNFEDDMVVNLNSLPKFVLAGESVTYTERDLQSIALKPSYMYGKIYEALQTLKYPDCH